LAILSASPSNKQTSQLVVHTPLGLFYQPLKPPLHHLKTNLFSITGDVIILSHYFARPSVHIVEMAQYSLGDYHCMLYVHQWVDPE